MDVDHAPRWNGENLRAKDVSIRYDNPEVRLQTLQTGGEYIASGSYRLKDRDPFGLRGDLNWWRDERGAGAALGLVRLGHYSADCEAALDQCLKGRHRKGRRPKED